MKIVVFGASGMVGKGVVLECLDAADVERVVVVGRSPCGLSHPKLDEILTNDLAALAPHAERLRDLDACFWCLGVSAGGMSEAKYREITRDLTLAAAKELLGLSPRLKFVYVSGAGTDPKGRATWARVKGETEDALLAMGFREAVMFRPGLIRPMRGVVSKTGAYRAFYAVASPLLPLLGKVAPSLVTTTERVGRAMLAVARNGSPKSHLENAEIDALAR